MDMERAAFPGSERVARLSGWIGLGTFLGFVAINVAIRAGAHPIAVIVGTLAAVAAGIPLFLRRPRVAIGLAGVATAGVVATANADPGDVGWFALAVLAAWCVLLGGVRVGVVYWAACLLVLGGEWLWARRDPGWAPWAAGLTVTVLAAVLVRHELVLVEQLRAAQFGLAERARVEERSRIARELHDVIAHALTVSLLHVTSARLAVEHDPADAARALAEAERLGRQSLAEIRATMGLLAPDRREGLAPPVAGIDQLGPLIHQVTETGVEVSLATEGDLTTLPATTGTTIYRIVQEAVTNATKHAPGYPIEVSVAARDGAVEVYIDSAGPAGSGSGMGLESMRERAKAVGGTCSAGPGGRGWLVHSVLPATDTREAR